MHMPTALLIFDSAILTATMRAHGTSDVGHWIPTTSTAIAAVP